MTFDAVTTDTAPTPRAFPSNAASQTRSTWYLFALGLATASDLKPVLGAPYLSIARWLSDFESWPRGRRRVSQERRLARIVAYAREHAPFYRERLARGGRDIPLAALPVVDKQQCGTSAARSCPTSGVTCAPSQRTGGSSGDPFRCPLDRVAWAHMYGARIHAYERHGYRYGEPMLMLGAPESLGLGTHGWTDRLRHVVERTDPSLTGYRLEHEHSLARARAAEARNAALWYGYAGTIAAMALAVLDAGVCVRAPRMSVTTAEELEPSWRDHIERAFGVPVYDDDGCNDGGIYVQSCERGRFHVAENLSSVEILDSDGRPCPPDEEGEVVVKNLHARALPLIRYPIGDRAVERGDPCPCGRSGVALERLTGRTWDQILLPRGRRLSAMAFWPVFKKTPHVRR